MRPIDADDLINEIKYHLWDWDTVNGITAQTVLKQTITDIKNQPTIDAIPVVRCHECKWYKEEKGIVGTGYCTVLKPAGDGQFICWSNWYCGDGKRKDDSN